MLFHLVFFVATECQIYCSMSLLDLWNNFFSEIHQFSIVVNGTFRWMMVENLWNTDATYSRVSLQLPLIINDSLPPLPLEKEAWALSSISSTLAFLPVCNTIGPQNRQSIKAFCLAIHGVRVDTAKVCGKHHYKMNSATLGGNLGRARISNCQLVFAQLPLKGWNFSFPLIPVFELPGIWH